MRLGLLFLLILQAVFIKAQDNSEIVITADLQLIPITENVYLHRSYKMYPMGRFASNGIVYIDNDKAIMIDTPGTDSLTLLLINWFSKKGIHFTAAIPTHWHDDCLGGLGTVHNAEIKSYGLNMTIELAKQHGYIPPQSGFDDSLILKLDDQVIECKYMGAGHAPDNIVVWLPAEKVLFGGCMVKSLSARGLGNTADADTSAWPKTINRVKSAYSSARVVVPGHGTPGGPDLLDYTHQLLLIQ
jgi:metallo-beta-lactamase class B